MRDDDTDSTANDDVLDFDLSDFQAFPSENDSGTQTDEPTTSVDSSPQPTAEEIRHNPAWNAVLEQIPAAFHSQITPTLKDWDRNFGSKMEEFAQYRQRFEPYQALVERGVAPEMVQGGLQLAAEISQNPVAFYERLKSALVQSGRIQDAQKVAQVQEEAQQNSFEDDDPYGQKLTELQQQQLQMQQYMQAQYEQQMKAQLDAEEDARIESEFSLIEEKLGRRLTPEVRQRVAQEVVMLDNTTGKQHSMVEGFMSLQNFMSSSQRRPAPRVISGTGGHVQPVAKKAEEMTKEDRQAWMVDFVQRNS